MLGLRLRKASSSDVHTGEDSSHGKLEHLLGACGCDSEQIGVSD